MAYIPTKFELSVLAKLPNTDMAEQLLDMYAKMSLCHSEADYPTYGDKFDALNFRLIMHGFGTFTLEEGGDIPYNFAELISRTRYYKNIKVC